MAESLNQAASEFCEAVNKFGYTFNKTVGLYAIMDVLEKSKTAMWLFILVTIAILAMIGAIDAYAGQETRYYGPQGQYQGRATTNSANPSQQSIYSNKGEYLGRAMTKPDGSVKYYDQHGRFMGSGLPSRPAELKK